MGIAVLTERAGLPERIQVVFTHFLPSPYVLPFYFSVGYSHVEESPGAL